MNQSLVILGRQPALGLAELESLYGSEHIRPVGDEAAIIALPSSEIAFTRLGGAIKLASVITVLELANWQHVEKYLYKLGPILAKELAEGKIQLGMSVYGLDVSPQKLLASGLTLKKILRKSGRSVRLSPNTEAALSSAQVFHNHLTGERGCELLFVRDGSKIIIARTTDVQNIDSYTVRDRERPKRDSKVGMLPPKLAQIIINLAVAQNKPDKDFAVLDPFCGTGVILQEALLMGFSADGSDIEQRMGDYTLANLDWLWQKFPETTKLYRGWQLGDATNIQWQTSKFTIDNNNEVIDAERVPMQIDTVACEGYLGQPFNVFPPEDKLRDVVQTCNAIAKGFLKNIHGQLQPGTRLCVGLPAWQKKPGEFLHLPVLDSLEELGYNRVSFEHVRDQELVYAREDQIVARELVTITRK